MRRKKGKFFCVYIIQQVSDDEVTRSLMTHIVPLVGRGRDAQWRRHSGAFLFRCLSSLGLADFFFFSFRGGSWDALSWKKMKKKKTNKKNRKKARADLFVVGRLSSHKVKQK
jgi:hypothetical protein